ncbi:Gustatory receptor 113 [Halyomorpha halys]|nr:Gustatory receptor 113 [Halyomorpha halys]
MVKVITIQPTIGKIERVFNDVFKFARVIGTFPINSEYSGISKMSLVKSILLHFVPTAIAIRSSYRRAFYKHGMLAVKLWKIIYYMSSVIFYWIHLVWLMRKRILLKELYEEMKDIEYDLWKNNVYWFYKTSWCRKYLSMSAILATVVLWIINNNFNNVINIIASYQMFNAFINVISQYANVVEVLTSILKEVKLIEGSVTVVRLTDKLLALCQHVNTLYEPQLFLYIFFVFLHNLFYIYTTILQEEHLSLNGSVWIMSFIFPLVQTVVTVGAFSQEVKKTNKMLYRRLLNNLEDEMLQFHLVAKRDLVFTAAGFFTLENTLICTMVTTGIDYLIFFLQYM